MHQHNHWIMSRTRRWMSLQWCSLGRQSSMQSSRTLLWLCMPVRTKIVGLVCATSFSNTWIKMSYAIFQHSPPSKFHFFDWKMDNRRPSDTMLRNNPSKTLNIRGRPQMKLVLYYNKLLTQLMSQDALNLLGFLIVSHIMHGSWNSCIETLVSWFRSWLKYVGHDKW